MLTFRKRILWECKEETCMYKTLCVADLRAMLWIRILGKFLRFSNTDTEFGKKISREFITSLWNVLKNM